MKIGDPIAKIEYGQYNSDALRKERIEKLEKIILFEAKRQEAIFEKRIKDGRNVRTEYFNSFANKRIDEVYDLFDNLLYTRTINALGEADYSYIDDKNNRKVVARDINNDGIIEYMSINPITSKENNSVKFSECLVSDINNDGVFDKASATVKFFDNVFGLRITVDMSKNITE